MNKTKKPSIDDIKKMGYVDFMATLDQINKPPGGKESIRKLVLNTFLTKESKVLDVGCIQDIVHLKLLIWLNVK